MSSIEVDADALAATAGMLTRSSEQLALAAQRVAAALQAAGAAAGSSGLAGTSAEAALAWRRGLGALDGGADALARATELAAAAYALVEREAAGRFTPITGPAR